MILGIVGFFIWGQNIALGASWNLEGINLVSRAARGADEKARLTTLSKEERSARAAQQQQAEMDQLKISNPNLYQKKLAEQEKKAAEAKLAQEKTNLINSYYASNHPYDRYPDYVEKKSGDLRLIREDMFTEEKNKIIVHHTAMPYKDDWTYEEVTEHLRLIYKDHINKFWDIGYHFLIDPSGLIYEGKAGGPAVAATHVSYNNIRSVGISLLWNFEIQPVTAEQRAALIRLLTALSRYYGIDPYEKVTYQRQITKAPYLQAHQGYAISTHQDTAATACPGKALYEDFENIRAVVANNLKNNIIKEDRLSFSPTGAQRFISNPKSQIRQLLPFFEQDAPKLTQLLDQLKSKYGKLVLATKMSNKIQDKIPASKIKQALNGEMVVLLHELSSEFNQYELSCAGGCKVAMNGWIHDAQQVQIRKENKAFSVQLDGASPQKTDSINLRGNQNLISIDNYERKSFAGIPRNSFRGELIFDYGSYPNIDGSFVQGLLVLNALPFQEYLKGIVETNDQESLGKNKIMALLAKNYALFYTAGGNIHPNIPQNANYQAIDDPDFFQKYVGAGAEKTLKKRSQALEATKNQVVLYQSYLPILPYFNCSAGFTISGKEKRGWQDTPYLKSMLDFGPCSDFNGHGVGLAGQGAEVLSQYGWSYDEIIEYYYPGVGVYDL